MLTSIEPRLTLLSGDLIKRKPIFLLRAAYRLFELKLLKKKKYRGVMFSTHYKCNFNCQHCYEKNFLNTGRKILTFEEKVAVLQQCLDIGVLSIDFIGGESHLDSRFEDLVAACQPKRTYITLATNGYGFNKEKIRHYKEIGIDKFNISLDNMEPKLHDQFRGKKGAHQQALNTLNLCRENGMATTLSVVVYKNYTKDKNFKNLVAFTIKENIRLAFKLAVPLGKWEMRNDVLVTKEDVETLRILCKKHTNLSRDIYGNVDGVCPAFRDFFTITAFGDVMPCNAIHISFGNLLEETLNGILNKSKNIKYFKNGYKGCIPAQNQEFIKKYLPKILDASPYPIRAEKMFKNLQNKIE